MENSWNKWQEFVLGELKELNESQKELTKGLNQISLDIATLKVKSGVWGLIGGLIPIAIFIGYMVLRQ